MGVVSKVEFVVGVVVAEEEILVVEEEVVASKKKEYSIRFAHPHQPIPSNVQTLEREC